MPNTFLSTVVKALIALTLAASLGLNAYLLVRNDASRQTAVGSQPVPVSERQGSCTDLEDRSSVQLLELEQYVAAVQADLRDALPLDELFDEEASWPQMDPTETARVRAIAGPDVDVQCATDVCRLRGRVSEAMESIQTDQAASAVIVSGSVSTMNEGYLLVNTQKRKAAQTILTDVALAVQSDPAFGHCVEPIARGQTLFVRLRFTTARILVLTSGPLARTDTGRCLKDVIQKVANRVTSAMNLTGIDSPSFAMRAP